MRESAFLKTHLAPKDFWSTILLINRNVYRSKLQSCALEIEQKGLC